MTRLLFFVLIPLFASAQIIDFPDSNFKNALLNTPCALVEGSDEFMDADMDNDGEIDMDEAASIWQLNVSGQGIPSLEGIEHFVGLWILDCSSNNLSELNLNLPQLKIFSCRDNQLTTLNVAMDASEEFEPALDCGNNLLSEVSISSGYYDYLNMENNQLTHFNFPGVMGNYLNVRSNPFTHFESSGFNSVDASNCLMTSCVINAEWNITVNDCPNLISAAFGPTGTQNAHNNPLLQSISLKDGAVGYIGGDSSAPHYYYTDNPSLEFVCVDDLGEWYYEGDYFYRTEAELVNVDPGVAVTYYCDLVPGGNPGMLSGTVSFNCNGSGIALTNNIRFDLDQSSDGSLNASAFPDPEGNFVFHAFGQGTLTPFINEYFTITPASFDYSLLSGNLSQHIDFCVSANGVHPDVEVTIVPLNTARSGFDANFRVHVVNRGTETQSGVLSFAYNEDLLDFTTSTPPALVEDGVVSWDFASLTPFNSFDYLVTLHVHSESDTQPVNIGDVLEFVVSAEIGPDETPANNSFVLYETVADSSNSNDKAVSTESLPVTQWDEYLYYTVRFQNTGNVTATNVVIRDILSNKLRVETLEVVGSSHWCSASMSSVSGPSGAVRNKMEFFFQNVNLPAGENGFVTYRIKPLSDLEIGDSITNQAEIYFDTHVPNTTNTVTTTIVPALSVGDNQEIAFLMYPNPSNSILYIQSAQEIKKVELINMLGQTVKTGHSPLDLSDTASGTYLVRVTTINGADTKLFVRN